MYFQALKIHRYTHDNVVSGPFECISRPIFISTVAAPLHNPRRRCMRCRVLSHCNAHRSCTLSCQLESGSGDPNNVARLARDNKELDPEKDT